MKTDVKGKLESAYVEAPFDVALKELKKEGYRIISLEENAKLRMQEGKDAFISRNGNYVQEAIIYDKDKGKFLTKYPIIIDNAQEATERHKNGDEFYLNDKQVSNAIKKGIAVKFPKIKDYSIPTDKFGEDIITDFAFGKIAKDYGLFLKDAGIKEMPIWFAGLKDKAFARQMWFGRLGDDDGSDLYGDYGYLNCDDWVRGVCLSASKAHTQKISYTPE